MAWLQNTLDFILESLLAEFIVVVAGVFFVLFVQKRWEKWKYGGWRVVITKTGSEILNRAISPRKLKEILDEDSDLAVFLKGVASPFEWINCDLLAEGRERGLLVIEHTERRFILDLDKNPPGNPGQHTEFQGTELT